jgi:hypothetical protein
MIASFRFCSSAHATAYGNKHAIIRHLKLRVVILSPPTIAGVLRLRLSRGQIALLHSSTLLRPQNQGGATASGSRLHASSRPSADGTSHQRARVKNRIAPPAQTTISERLLVAFLQKYIPPSHPLRRNVHHPPAVLCLSCLAMAPPYHAMAVRLKPSLSNI